jgi:hypothetical protein
VNFQSYGLYLYDGTTWTQLTSNGGVQDLIGVSSDLYTDYGTAGLWKYNGAWSPIGSADANRLGTYGEKLVANFPAYGLYEYDGSTWVSLTGNNGVTDMVGVDLP